MKQVWNKKSINQHYIDLDKNSILDSILGLKSEGKNIINILNQKTLAKRLEGEFVGDKIDDYDIVANNIKLELKCNVNQATDLGKTVGMGSFLQKNDWNYIIHYTPKAFNSYLDEDKFVIFTQSDIKKAIKNKWINQSGGIRWTHKIYDPNHKINNSGGHKKKLEFIKNRIVNFQELKQLIYA
jgi:hypothetical protein